MDVEFNLPFGPIIDDQVTKFQGAKGNARIYCCEDYAQLFREIEPLTAEEFATSVGSEMIGLPLFSVSSHEVAYRRAYSALRSVIPKAENAPRVFFKYWCFPRIPPAAVHSVFQAHKQDWQQDQTLIQSMERITRNE